MAKDKEFNFYRLAWGGPEYREDIYATSVLAARKKLNIEGYPNDQIALKYEGR